MGLYDRIKELAAQKKVSIRKLEEDLDFANGTVRQWNKSTPGFDRVMKVADYFHVTEAYLLGRVEAPGELDWNSIIRDDENFGVNKKGITSSNISDSDLESQLEGAEAYGGMPMSDNDREILKGMIRSYMETKYKGGKDNGI